MYGCNVNAFLHTLMLTLFAQYAFRVWSLGLMKAEAQSPHLPVPYLCCSLCTFRSLHSAVLRTLHFARCALYTLHSDPATKDGAFTSAPPPLRAIQMPPGMNNNHADAPPPHNHPHATRN